MGYRLAEQNGESVAVPRLVFAHLARADGDTIRAALYLLGGGGTDPRTMARDLGMPSIEAAKRAMQYWAGAGLLVSDRDAPLPKTEMQKASAIDLTTLNDPYVSVLCEEAQTAFGKALSRTEMQRLVSLYLNDGWQPDVVLLCCAEVARQGRRTVGALSRELLNGGMRGGNRRGRRTLLKAAGPAGKLVHRVCRPVWHRPCAAQPLGARSHCPLARGLAFWRGHD